MKPKAAYIAQRAANAAVDPNPDRRLELPHSIRVERNVSHSFPPPSLGEGILKQVGEFPRIHVQMNKIGQSEILAGDFVLVQRCGTGHRHCGSPRRQNGWYNCADSNPEPESYGTDQWATAGLPWPALVSGIAPHGCASLVQGT